MDWQLLVDLERQLKFPNHIAGTTLRPDIVLVSESTKQAVLLELTVPWEDRLEEAVERKLSKSVEKWLGCELSSFLLLNNLLDPHQSGFRPGHSTETALLSVSARISACLRDIQSWMDNHHLKLNQGKTEMIFIPAPSSNLLDFSISLGDTVMSSSPTAKNLGVVMDNRLSLSQNNTAVSRTFRFFLYNIRRTRPFLTIYATQLLVQAMVLSRLDYCNSLLAGLPASAIRPLQLIQNAAARLVYNLPRHSHVTPLLTDLHWDQEGGDIRFRE
ncbi:uncharacterized protein LOC135256013 [Anguilla rostrata]|uniref:uncharacterized protein LOC135256013 n=1 Tax=Anguilla rostrata TaxID=7938 RepID=UPI0030D00BBF